MPNPVAHVRLVTLFAAVAFAPALSAQATGQEPALEVFYTKLEPKEPFKYKWKATAGACTAGVFRWEVPATEFGTNGLDRNFTGYCAEVLVPITADKRYRFQMNSIYAPKNYGLPATGDRAAERRAKYIRELFGRFYHDPVAKPVDPTDAVALQVALWEVIQETEPADGPPKLDLFGGDFQADYPRAEAPLYVTRAQEYLDALTGDDVAYYQNPDLRGRELVRLQGIANAEGVVAQSQFALRYVGGGATGGGFARALTAAGGAGAMGFGGLGGGFGGIGGLGGGGGLLAGTGGGGSAAAATTSPATTSTTTPVTTTTSNPASAPITPTTSLTTPPANDPDMPGSPVPVPAGLLLGFIALGTIGSWRLGSKLLASK